VLEGARSVLSARRPVVIFEHVRDTAELHGVAPGAPWELLTDLGYDIFSATGDGPFTRAAFTQDSSTVNWLARPQARGASRGESPLARTQAP
jgi:hypothetical protein